MDEELPAGFGVSVPVLNADKQDHDNDNVSIHYYDRSVTSPQRLSGNTQQGLWYLLPKQDVLTREEDDVELTLDDVAVDLTIVITTSVGEFTTSADIVITALRSLQDNLAWLICHHF